MAIIEENRLSADTLACNERHRYFIGHKPE